MARIYLELTHSSSLSPASGGGGGPCFCGKVSRKQRATQIGCWIVKKAQELKVETETLPSVLPHSYECSTYTAGANQWRV
jgi:hypothetical protein